MGLTNVIKNSSKIIFNTLGDLTIDFTLITKQNQIVDLSTATVRYNTTSKTYKGILSNFSKREIEYSSGSIESTDKKLVFSSESDLDISLNDNISIGGITYNIVNEIKNDITGSIITLNLRK